MLDGGEIEVSVAEKVNKKTGLYKGPGGMKIGRGIGGYEGVVQHSDEKLHVNQTIVAAIEEAKTQGRNEVTIFDFGCGDGNMFRDILSDPSSKVIQIIKSHPGIQVNFIGLTDTSNLTNAPTEQELASGKELPLPEGASNNISARIDYNAITRARTLEQYFVDHEIQHIDRAFAIESLQYIPAKNFYETLESIINKLQFPGATFVATSYMKDAPLFGWGNKDYLVRSVHEGRTEGSTINEKASLKATLLERGVRFRDPQTDIRQEIQNLQLAFEHYKELEGLTQDQIDSMINQFLPEDVVKDNALAGTHPQLDQLLQQNIRLHLAQIADYLIHKGGINFEDTRRKKSQEQKSEALTHLQKAYENEYDYALTKNYLRIIRK